MLNSKKIRKGIIIILVFMLMSSFSPMTFAEGINESISGTIKLVINGQEILPDIAPQIINDRVMLPAKCIAEPLGAIIDWDETTQSVLINSSAIKVGKTDDNIIRIFVSGKLIQPDVAPEMINGVIMTPVRWIAEALGATVNWDDATRTVTLDKAGEGYGKIRELRDKDGNVVLTLQPDELFIFTTNQKIYENVPETREKFIGQYIKQAFPGLKYKIVHWDNDGGLSEEDFVRSGVYPDIYMETADRNTTRMVKTWGMEYDLSSFIKKYNFDLSRLNTASVNLVKDRGAGSIYSLPFEINDYIMYYNKRFFDACNQSYPIFGMTYDQAFEKALTLSYQDGFNQIKGYTQHPDQYLKLNQRGYSPFSQTEPNKVVLANQQYLDLANNIRRFYDITGNIYTSTEDFFNRGACAMCVDSLEKLPYICLKKDYIGDYNYSEWAGPIQKNNITNWDISSVPVFADAPGKIYLPNVLTCFITKQSQMKETAFKVIATLLTDDVQLERSGDGLKGVVKTDEIANSFGTNVPEYKNLNLKAVYWGENASITPRSPEVAGNGYWDISLWEVFRKYIFQYGLSTDAALLRVEQEQNKSIQDQIASGKKW